jgi:hypothetical protein
MTPRELIAEAWDITRREIAIRRWAITSSFFELLLTIKLLATQVYLFYEYTQGNAAGFFDIEIAMYNAMPHGLFWAILIAFWVLVGIEFVAPNFCEGAIIGLAAKAHRKERVEGGPVLALYNFAPLFAFNELFLLSKITNAVTACSLILRYVDHPLKWPSVWFVIFVFALSVVLQFFSSFGAQAIVIRKENVFQAIGRSFKLIISYLKHVLFLKVLLLIISLRILLNALVVLLVPAITIGLGLLLGTFLAPIISYTIAVIVGIALLLVASYFFAFVHVFKQTVWTLAYLHLSDRKDLDVIME